MLTELGDAETLTGLDKRFLFYLEDQLYRHYPPEPERIDRRGKPTAELPWRCYEDYERAAEICIEVKLVGVTVRDEFEFALNGEPIAPGRIERLHAPSGRDQRVHWRRLDPFSLYRIDPDPEALRRGENVLAVTMAEREPDLFGEVLVRDLAVEVRYPQALSPAASARS